GNGANGVEIQGAEATGNTVSNNSIGVSLFGADLGNAGNGVLVYGASVNSIGPFNTIAFNGKSTVATRAGVAIVDALALPPGKARGKVITMNSIFVNMGLGIDRGADGVTLNDSMGHVGANNFQNFPIVTGAFFDGLNTTITAVLSMKPGSSYVIEFFSNLAP